jgi:mono/diheme cytochrome c family protein
VSHGAGGFRRSNDAENRGHPPPPTLLSAPHPAHAVGDTFGEATHGKGRMPSYAPQLTTAERWAVAAYVQRLQAGGATTPEQRDDSVRALRIRAIDSTLAAERRR